MADPVVEPLGPAAEGQDRAVGVDEGRGGVVDLVVEDDVVLGHLLAQVGDEGVAHPLGLGQGFGVGAELAHLVGLHRQRPLPVDRGRAGEEDGVDDPGEAGQADTRSPGVGVDATGLGSPGGGEVDLGPDPTGPALVGDLLHLGDRGRPVHGLEVDEVGPVLGQLLPRAAHLPLGGEERGPLVGEVLVELRGPPTAGPARRRGGTRTGRTRCARWWGRCGPAPSCWCGRCRGCGRCGPRRPTPTSGTGTRGGSRRPGRRGPGWPRGGGSRRP